MPIDAPPAITQHSNDYERGGCDAVWQYVAALNRAAKSRSNHAEEAFTSGNISGFRQMKAESQGIYLITPLLGKHVYFRLPNGNQVDCGAAYTEGRGIE